MTWLALIVVPLVVIVLGMRGRLVDGHVLIR
jgi:hypothetical protein